MKTAFLVVYLWQGTYANNATVGGPALSVTPMPSIEACEQVGAAVKDLVDSEHPIAWAEGQAWLNKPALYRCIEVENHPPTVPYCRPRISR